MIEHFTLLRNIGQFDSITPGAQLPFAKLTVIYAENGRGKTTLSGVLRSLATGDATLIHERRRLGAAHPPHVIIQTVGGANHTFANGAWSAPLTRLAVFDDIFVAANVCSGLEIASEHRQNLHELILGSQGVALNAALKTHVDAIEQHNRDLREKSNAIPAAARGNFNVDQFCDLPAIPDIVERLRDAERRLAAAQSAAAIQREPIFGPLDLPSFDLEAINAVLGRSLADLDAAAAQQVQTHLASLGTRGEQWIAEGVDLIPAASQGVDREACPFCKQALEGSVIIAHYRAYFGAAYTFLKEAITTTKREITAAHGGDVPAAFERAVRVATQRREFWSRFAQVPDTNIDTAAIALAWRSARDAVETALTAKQAAPLEAAALDDCSISAIQAYHDARAAVAELSAALLIVNPQLAVVKEQAQAADVSALTADLARLRATQERYSTAIAPLCQAYLTEKQAKVVTEGLRDAGRVALDNYQRNIFPRYQTAINAYLQRFGAGFRLDRMASVNNRAGSSVNYVVLINQNQVPLTAEGAPSFRSALSSGDRNTLALAFFFASLEQDPALADKIVVIDDPMTSLDEHRTLVTVQEICHLSTRVAQLIVLSHFKPFLMKVWEGLRCNRGRTSMQITRAANASQIAAWDVNADMITEHDRRYARVLNYLQAADPATQRQVAADLRPMLEAFIRVAYPHEFRQNNNLLGRFINTCQQQLNTHQQLLNEAHTRELRAILAYANLFHHDTNPTWQTQIINDQELTQFAQRTLAFIRR
jgi:wobble nucleotide-excising tRNase